MAEQAPDSSITADGKTSTGSGLGAQPTDINDTIPGVATQESGVTTTSTALDSEVTSRGADAGQLPGPGDDRGSVSLDAGIDPGGPIKKKKSKGQRRKGGLIGHKRASGFEEFYADPPLSPAEAVEEEGIYSQSRPFFDRMEECIQRYRARRRMDPEQINMFSRYMFMGGINSLPRQFTGMALDTESLAAADKDQARTMTAVDFIGGSGSRYYEIGDEEHWDVDFEGVAKGFLSRTTLDMYMYDGPAIVKAAELIKNFLNYVLAHNACPEYTANIMAARNVCDAAPQELRAAHELLASLPGSFNGAGTSLFCEREDAGDLGNQKFFDEWVIFRLTILERSSNTETRKKLAGLHEPSAICAVDIREQEYEVRDIQRPRAKYKKMFEEELARQGLGGDRVKPAGCVILGPAIIAHGRHGLPRPDEVDLSSEPGEEYLLEDELLAKLQPGMKLRLVTCGLTFAEGGEDLGLRFIKEALDVRVSFDTFLPQSLMANWRDPVPNERPAPSVSNPKAESTIGDVAGTADFD